MNRNDFMRQLESLLQNIAPGERDEALQYYNDYFDDAGKENEQEVIEALGNPARVAESIRRDLLGGNYGEGTGRKALASDRALMEYGQDGEAGESGKEADGASAEQERAGKEAASEAGPEGRSGAEGNSAGFQDSGVFQDSARFGESVRNPAQDNPQDRDMENWGQETYRNPEKKPGMPAWCIALLVTLAVLFSPAVLGIAAAALGTLLCLVVAWFGLLLAFGGVSLALLVVLFTLVVVGIMCMPVNPWVGMSVAGGGLICGAIGILFLMLTVAMGAAVPAICKGIAFLFRRKKSVRG